MSDSISGLMQFLQIVGMKPIWSTSSKGEAHTALHSVILRVGDVTFMSGFASTVAEARESAASEFIRQIGASSPKEIEIVGSGTNFVGSCNGITRAGSNKVLVKREVVLAMMSTLTGGSLADIVVVDPFAKQIPGLLASWKEIKFPTVLSVMGVNLTELGLNDIVNLQLAFIPPSFVKSEQIKVAICEHLNSTYYDHKRFEAVGDKLISYLVVSDCESWEMSPEQMQNYLSAHVSNDHFIDVMRQLDLVKCILNDTIYEVSDTKVVADTFEAFCYVLHKIDADKYTPLIRGWVHQ